jgi:hypothetical protein
VKKIIILLFLAGSLLGCSKGDLSAIDDEANSPFFIGKITSLNKSRAFMNSILVSGSSDKYGSEYVFGITSETVILNNKGKEISYNNLKVGHKVRVWLPEGTVEILQSKPPQTFAQRIIVE